MGSKYLSIILKDRVIFAFLSTDDAYIDINIRCPGWARRGVQRRHTYIHNTLIRLDVNQEFLIHWRFGGLRSGHAIAGIRNQLPRMNRLQDLYSVSVVSLASSLPHPRFSVT